MYTSGKNNKVIVTGGGAAGLCAALFACRGGADVTLLEKNEKLGKKIYITGKGRCNCTNSCDTEEFLRNVPHNPRFLYSALRLLPPDALMALLESIGCALKVERGNRVFPVSDHASDVTYSFENELRRTGVHIRLRTTVKDIVTDEGAVRGVVLENGETLPCDRLIIATGGLSYPVTGSTGDGMAFAKKTGHRITETCPSLVPIETKEEWPTELQGLSLKNVCLSANFHGKTIYSEQGEMLFTHFGISGPLALSCSCHIGSNAANGVMLSLDMKPALSEEQLDQRLLREFNANSRKQLGTVLPALLPARMGPVFAKVCGIDPQKPCNQITTAERKKMIAMLKALPMTVSGLRGYSEAIVTHGGVDVRDITPSTMESKLVKHLYFAGETLDVDAYTGGFNLQIAFATGALAGKSAAENELN